MEGAGIRALGIVATLCVLAPGRADADWFASAYLGSAHTASNTLPLIDGSGAPLTIGPVDYHGNSWHFPLYYGYRGGWSPRGSRFGIEGEWTHAKAIGRTGSAELTHFELSHGLNTLLANVVFRSRGVCGARCTLALRGGLGAATPHVEADFRGRRVSEYQLAGIAAQGGAGVELRLWQGLHAIVDGRASYARIEADLPGAHLESTGFTTLHVDVGLGWRFGR
jgi:hypothetical protein